MTASLENTLTDNSPNSTGRYDCMLMLSTLHEIALQTAGGQNSALCVRSSQDPAPTAAPLGSPTCPEAAGNISAEKSIPDSAAGLHTLYREQERRKRVLGWRRSHKGPFEGEWEQILSWLVTNPERSSGDIFRELQRHSPRRYQPLQIRTLQRGMRKIRAHLLGTMEEQWQEEVIRGSSPPQVSSAENPARIS